MMIVKKVLLLLTIVASTALAEGENYCHDEETWIDWEQKMAKYPDDLGFKTLYALRDRALQLDRTAARHRL